MKRTLTSIVAATMVLGTAIPAAFAANAQPNDVSGNKYQTAIDTLSIMGTLPLYSDGSFRPDLTVSRGQAIAYLFNVASQIGTDGNNPMPTYTLKQQPFQDENSFFRNQINNMYLAGYLNNVDLGNGAIGQNYKTPTWWFAQVLCNIAGVSYDSGNAYDALNQARAKGWFDNTDDKTANPNYYLSRGEMAQVMENFFIALDQKAFTGVVTSATLAAASANTSAGTSDALTITAKDATGATVDLTKGTHTVTYNVTSSNAANAAITSSGNFVATQPGTYTVTATVDGITTAAASIVVAGAAAGMTLTPASATLVANGASTDAVTLQVVDASGNPVSNFNGTVTVADSGQYLVDANGALQFTLAGVAVTNGKATVTVQASTTVGASYTLTASALQATGASSAVTDANGNGVTATATISQVSQVATGLVVTPSAASVENNASTQDKFTVQVVDQAGKAMLVGTYPVTLAISGPGTFDASVQTTTAYVGNGLSTTVVNGSIWSEIGVSGTVTVTATSAGLTAGTANIASVVVGAPKALKLAVDAASANTFVAGVGNNSVLDITTVDANGNPVNDPGATYTAAVTQGSTTVTSGVYANVVGSKVTVTGTVAGTYTITVNSSDGLTAAAQDVTVTPGAASTVTITSPATSTIDLPIGNNATTISAQVVDGNGNAVAVAGTSVTFAVYTTAGSDSATLSGNTTGTYTTTTNANGVASINFVGSHTTGDIWNVYVQKVGTTTVSLSPVVVKMVAAVPTTLTVGLKDTAQAPGNNPVYANSTAYAESGDTVTGTLSATDSYGNASSNNDVIQVTLPAGLTALSGLTPTSTAGVYTITLTSPTMTFSATASTAGAAQVQVRDLSVGSSSLTGSGSITVVPSTASKALFYSAGAAVSSTNVVTAAANIPVALTLTAVDAAGNPVVEGANTWFDLTDATGQFRTVANGANVNGVEIPAGSSSVTVYYVNSTAGTYSGMTATMTPTVTSATYSSTKLDILFSGPINSNVVVGDFSLNNGHSFGTGATGTVSGNTYTITFGSGASVVVGDTVTLSGVTDLAGTPVSTATKTIQ